MTSLKLFGLLTAVLYASGSSAIPVVTLRNGTYEGLHLHGFNQDVFLGIPYAQDTSGQNRFRIPQALNETWEGVRNAKSYGPACPDDTPGADAIYGMSEDCLSINIVRPSGVHEGSNLPVMVWIHGGSYQVGTSALAEYNLTYIVQKSVEMGMPIIACSINYRLGAWGNMYSIEIQGSGNTNLALRDMRKSLAWISENIENFGGNSSSVTIWGESSGSFAIGQLLMSYGGRTDGLFHRSIQESGSAATAWYNGSDWYQPLYNNIVNQVECTGAIDTLACLRTVDYKTLYLFMNSTGAASPGFYPTVDGDIIPNYPTAQLQTGQFAHIPHLYGTNSDEGTVNAPTGIINTDEDLRDYLLYDTGFQYPEEAVERIMELYPDDPALGVPIDTGSQRFVAEGYQYKRVAAIVGDVFYHGPRLDDARHYSKYSPTYIYRFNTRPYKNYGNGTGSLEPAYIGVTHASEIPFVFRNFDYVGPWPEYQALSEQMSAEWICFANTGNPNGEGLPSWPSYSDGPLGYNLVLQTRSQGSSYVEEDTYRLAGREYLSKWSRRRHV